MTARERAKEMRRLARSHHIGVYGGDLLLYAADVVEAAQMWRWDRCNDDSRVREQARARVDRALDGGGRENTPK